MVTQLAVGQQRKRFESAGYPTFPVKFEGAVAHCFVLPSSLKPELPNFAFQMVDDNFDFDTQHDRINEHVLIGVADSIPEECRNLVACHELFEYIFKMTCPEASKREIDLSSTLGGRQREYLTMRRDFFGILEAFARGKPGYEQKLPEFRESYELFQQALS